MFKETIHSAIDTAKDAAEEGSHVAAGSMRQVAKGTRSTAAGAIKALASGVALVRALGVDDVLRLVGLRRRASPLATAAVFGAGFALGAGLGVLLAPAAGKQTQRALGSFAKQLAGEAEHKVEDAAGAVGDAAWAMAKAAEKKVERARAAVGKTVDDAVQAVDEEASDIRTAAGLGRVGDDPSGGARDPGSARERARTGAVANHNRHS